MTEKELHRMFELLAMLNNKLPYDSEERKIVLEIGCIVKTAQNRAEFGQNEDLVRENTELHRDNQQLITDNLKLNEIIGNMIPSIERSIDKIIKQYSSVNDKIEELKVVQKTLY